MSDQIREIGEIFNSTGFLYTKKSKDYKYYWSIGGYDGHIWFEIPEYLYIALNKHEDEREASLEKTNN